MQLLLNFYKTLDFFVKRRYNKDNKKNRRATVVQTRCPARCQHISPIRFPGADGYSISHSPTFFKGGNPKKNGDLILRALFISRAVKMLATHLCGPLSFCPKKANGKASWKAKWKKQTKKRILKKIRKIRKKAKSRRSGKKFPTEAYEATGQQPADKGQPKQADETAGLGEENFLS